MPKKTSCKSCVLDSSVEDFTIEKDGHCNYCHAYWNHLKNLPNTDTERAEGLNKVLNKIRNNRSPRSNYDCIIGLSGGVDSSYLALKAYELGLKPLLVHVDTGWNSEIAVMNVYNIVERLNLDLYTYVVNWEEMRDLQVAFLRSSLPDCDIPQDHVFPIVLNKVAAKFNVKYILSGHNVVGEFISPSNWMYDSNDLSHLLDVYRKYGRGKLKQYPKNSLWSRYIYYRNIKKIESVRLLYFLDYKSSDAIREIQDRLGWKSYGLKHEESRFTKFFQKYYLYEKFGFDKRKAHLSNLILSGSITKNEALEVIQQKPYDEEFLHKELPYTLKKLGLSKSQWSDIMSAEPRKHSEFHSDYSSLFYLIIKKLARLK